MSLNNRPQKKNTDALQHWLNRAGLNFDPFFILNAAEDARLSDYLVGHQAFSAAWGNWISFIFATMGGGKTALRVRVAQSCWVGQETNRPFAISYTPNFLQFGNALPSLSQYLQALCQTGAEQLFFALAYRPHWLLRLSNNERERVRHFLQWNLQEELEFYLDELQESQTPAVLSQLAPTHPPLQAPPYDELRALCRTLRQTGPPSPPPPPAEQWRILTDLLLNVFLFRAVFVLVDALDAILKTARNPQRIVDILSSLLPHLETWTEQGVFAKFFLPTETQNLLAEQYSGLMKQAAATALVWRPELLAEIIRRRIFVASQGNFGSLSAIASPGLRDIELQLAKEIPPLPREMLVITRELLVQTAAYSADKISADDVSNALARYRASSVFHISRKKKDGVV